MTSRALAFAVASLAATPALAADVLVMSNNGAVFVAMDFGVNTSHTYTAWDANQTPTLDQLQAYEAVLLFENGVFANSPNIGDALAEYAEQGGGVVTATFFLQDHSLAGIGNGWGNLEQYDPFLPSGGGCEYNTDDLDAATIVDHPITAGVAAIHANSYRGGASAKPDANVLALWASPNPDGGADPLVGYRQEGNACVVGITIFPDASYMDFSGDVYVLFDNALQYATNCASPGPCGNGVLDPGELCDDGNFQNNDACVAGCVPASCGDGFTHVGVEPCDDNDLDNTDACLVGCIAASCGDGFIQAGVEACDDDNLDNTDACVDPCQLASCGDGYVFDGFETCDDANDVDGDGCTSCQLDAPETTSGAQESSSEGGGSEGSSEGGPGDTSGGAEASATQGDDTSDTAVDGTGTEGGSSGGGDASASATDGDDGGSTGGGATDVSGGEGGLTGGRGGPDTGCSCSSTDGSRPGFAWLILMVGGLATRRRAVTARA